MSKYRQGLLNINVWKKDEKYPRQYAMHEDEQVSMIKKLENALLYGKIIDYEIFGFADFCDPFTRFGDILYFKKRRNSEAKA